MNTFDRNKLDYNFVFMFASPSYIPLEGGSLDIHIKMAPLKHREEYKYIKESLKKAQKDVTLHKVLGTVYNLREVLEKNRPGAIHFSGHGMTAEEIKREHLSHQGATLMTDS